MRKNKLLWGLSILLFILLCVAYAKHFDNDFHFDDAHTIQDNAYIKDIQNIPSFFTEGAERFSSLPANQVYRPVVTSSIAIDYWLSEKFYPESFGFDTRPYHWSMFFEYLILLALIFFFAKKVFDKIKKSDWNIWFALFATAWYGLHTVNAETLNYIISRSDLLSTLFVVASFVVYQYAPKQRKWGLFFLPFVLGVFTKLTAAMFIPLFIIYYYIFEYQDKVASLKSRTEKRKYIKTTLLQALVPMVLFVGSVYFVISQQSESFTPGTASRWDYLLTQPFVILHYFISFFYPYLLSADTDWRLIPVTDWRFYVGLVFVAIMAFVVFKTAFKKHLRPIAFGILWFFVALAPTSSLIPLSEVLNDHRMMFPFVGLLISVVWSLKLVFEKYEEKIMASMLIKNLIVLAITILLSAHMMAVIKRVAVWDNGESLWYDVTIKSPKNGRGLMNYGLKKMNQGNYEMAMEYFNKALVYSPYYSYLHTNIAIVQDELGELETSEESHLKAIKLAANNYKSYYYYANFLKKHKRYSEALDYYNKSLLLAPQFIYSRYALLEVYSHEANWKAASILANQSQEMFPKDATIIYYVDYVKTKLENLDITDFNVITDVQRLINLSVEYYKVEEFGTMITVCKRILALDANNAVAYNNLCSAYNMLGQYQNAIESGQQALAIDSESQLAKNNLALARKRLAMQQQIESLTTVNELIQLSITFYKEKMFEDCISASKKVLLLDPKNHFAYNNICSAYNALDQYDKASQACEKALEIKPDFEHAKNNLKVAISNAK